MLPSQNPSVIQLLAVETQFYSGSLRLPPGTLIFSFLEDMQIGTQWLRRDKTSPEIHLQAVSLFLSSHLSPGLNASPVPVLAAENEVLANAGTLLPQNATGHHTLCSDNGQE